jgi:GAF domain-containing protein
MTRPASTETLGAELERDRLERRIRRVAIALSALQGRASEHGRELGAPPRHLRQAIADFEAQIQQMNARLRELAPERPATGVQRWGRLT